MKVATPLLALLAVSVGSTAVIAADQARSIFQYESDVARLRSIVVNSLYGSKDIFLRELLSNANDALEKLRLTGLTDPSVIVGSGELNVTISAVKATGEGGEPGQLVLRDTGIGMRPDELKTNLGTIAKSGTSDFLSKAEASSAPLASDNLIGQFGLGFYSSFLIADKVEVASLPPPTAADPNPKQHVFRSNAAGSSFEVYEDPRGNTLGERGTEITLFLREGENEWLEEQRVRELVEKHSAFASAFPIYLETHVKSTRPILPLEHEPETLADADEASVEDDDAAEPETEEVETVAFEQLNKHEPLWMREPKSVTEEEYNGLYRALSKDSVDPLAWLHFKGETGAGIGFRSLIYVPSELPVDFWQRANDGVGRNVRMLVKRVFITDDLGDGFLPKWLSFLRIVVDADDLPLTVSRNTLSSSKFISQLSRTLVKRSLDLFTKLATSEPEKYAKLYKLVGHAFKAGIADRSPEKTKLAGLLRFESNHINSTSLDDYVSRRKQGQKQIFFLAGVGQSAIDLLKSPFVEKLDARGYEVLLLNEPLDEIVISHLRTHDSLVFQDVSKKGFRFGDEDLDREEDQQMQAQMKDDFAPLAAWIKQAFGNIISEVVVSTRLVSSPTAIVAESHGLSANMMRLMAAQASAAGEDDPMLAFAKSQKKVLEINPHSPLIQGLLEVVAEADDDDHKAGELRDTIETLLDVTLVRSGFPVEDMNSFFGRVEGLLRRSVGVPTKAKTYQPPVKPAPAVETVSVEPMAVPDYGNLADADEAEVERLLREVKDFGPAGAAAADELEFEDFDREQVRRKMTDMRHPEL